MCCQGLLDAQNVGESIRMGTLKSGFCFLSFDVVGCRLLVTSQSKVGFIMPQHFGESLVKQEGSMGGIYGICSPLQAPENCVIHIKLRCDSTVKFQHIGYGNKTATESRTLTGLT